MNNDRYLYKAKRTDNGKWVEGYYLPIGDKTYIICEAETECMDGENTDLYATERYEVDYSTICQCTGIPDRHKTLMYENDIVRTNSGVCGVIRFGRYGDEKNDYGFYVEWEKSQPYWRNDIYFWQSELRLIGSTIDNPKLLEVEE